MRRREKQKGTQPLLRGPQHVGRQTRTGARPSVRPGSTSPDPFSALLCATQAPVSSDSRWDGPSERPPGGEEAGGVFPPPLSPCPALWVPPLHLVSRASFHRDRSQGAPVAGTPWSPLALRRRRYNSSQPRPFPSCSASISESLGPVDTSPNSTVPQFSTTCQRGTLSLLRRLDL